MSNGLYCGCTSGTGKNECSPKWRTFLDNVMSQCELATDTYVLKQFCTSSNPKAASSHLKFCFQPPNYKFSADIYDIPGRVFNFDANHFNLPSIVPDFYGSGQQSTFGNVFNAGSPIIKRG